MDKSKHETSVMDVNTLVRDKIADRNGKICTPEIQKALQSAGMQSITDLENVTWKRVLQGAITLVGRLGPKGSKKIIKSIEKVIAGLKPRKK